MLRDCRLAGMRGICVLHLAWQGEKRPIGQLKTKLAAVQVCIVTELMPLGDLHTALKSGDVQWDARCAPACDLGTACGNVNPGTLPAASLQRGHGCARA